MAERPNGVSDRSLEVEIAYHAVDLSSNRTKAVLLGLQLSVQPTNLLRALVAWKTAPTTTRVSCWIGSNAFFEGRSMADV